MDRWDLGRLALVECVCPLGHVEDVQQDGGSAHARQDPVGDCNERPLGCDSAEVPWACAAWHQGRLALKSCCVLARQSCVERNMNMKLYNSFANRIGSRSDNIIN